MRNQAILNRSNSQCLGPRITLAAFETKNRLIQNNLFFLVCMQLMKKDGTIAKAIKKSFPVVGFTIE